MALPSREQTFAFENCRDVLRKLEREVERFHNAGNSLEMMIDAAFNAAVTAWHLCDWVFADLTEKQRVRLQIRSLGEMQERARECRELYLCRHAATASKHWKVTDHPDPTVGVIVTATPIPAAGPSTLPLHTQRAWHIYFVDGHKTMAAHDVFELAVQFWTQFIYPNEIGK